jgi:hypothetical protein
MIEPTDILTGDELTERLKVKRPWLYNMNRKARKTGFPVINMGKYKRYSWKAVCEWLESRPAPERRRYTKSALWLKVRKAQYAAKRKAAR